MQRLALPALPALPQPQCPVPMQAGPAGSAVPWQRGWQPQRPDVEPQPSPRFPVDSARAAPRGRRTPAHGAAPAAGRLPGQPVPGGDT